MLHGSEGHLSLKGNTAAKAQLLLSQAGHVHRFVLGACRSTYERGVAQALAGKLKYKIALLS